MQVFGTKPVCHIFGFMLQVRFRHDSNFVGTANSMVWRIGSSIYWVSAQTLFLDLAAIMRKSRNQTFELTLSMIPKIFLQ